MPEHPSRARERAAGAWQGRQAWSDDANGNIPTLTDDAGSATFPGGRTYGYTYDAVGNILSATGPAGSRTGAVDPRFASLLTGGRSPSPGKGWRPLEVSEEALTRLLLRSDKKAARPGYTGVLMWGFAAWNGHPDEGTSVGMSSLTEGPVADPIPLRSYTHIGGGIVGLTPAQVDAIVAAVMEAWDPDDAKREEWIDEAWRVTTFARGEGWRAAR